MSIIKNILRSINNLEEFFLPAVAVVIVMITWFWPTVELYFSPDYASAATSVAVTASITTTITCSTDQTSTAFGTLTSSAITTSSPNASTSITCANSAAGCTMTVFDAGGTGTNSKGGLWNSTSTSLIESPNAAFDATTTLVAGTEGYGIRATTTSAGSGATLSIVQRYNTGLVGGLLGSVNDVGGLSTSTVQLTIASTTATTSAREIVVTHKAAIAAGSAGGNYDDTITYGCTAN